MTRTRAAAANGLPTLQPAGHGDSRVLAALVAAAAQPTPTHPDAELLALTATVDRMEVDRARLRIASDEPDCSPDIVAAYDEIDASQHVFLKRLATVRATTAEGLAAQARALTYCHPYGFSAEELRLSGPTDSRLVWAIVSALTQRPFQSDSVPVVALPAIEHSDAKVLALGADLVEVHVARAAFYARYPGTDDDPFYERHWDLRKAITRIKATTFAGLRVKARAAQMALQQDPSNECEGDGSFLGLSCSLIADILRLAPSTTVLP